MEPYDGKTAIKSDTIELEKFNDFPTHYSHVFVSIKYIVRNALTNFRCKPKLIKLCLGYGASKISLFQLYITLKSTNVAKFRLFYLCLCAFLWIKLE